jgi:predicted dehydrogenase
MSKKSSQSRRSFLSKVGTGLAGLSIAPAVVRAEHKKVELLGRTRYAANDQVNLALIGAGGMGQADTETALQIPGVKLVAACDLYDGRLEAAKKKWGADLFTTRNYQEVLDRKDVDAVIVATPDHWHKDISVEALNKGKGVYVEKPMVHSIEEGKALIEAQAKSKKTLEVGSQGLSSLGNEKAKELYEAGAIGKLNYAEGFWARNSPFGAWQYDIPGDASEKTVDWKRFLNKYPARAFDPIRFFRWRCYKDYGTGVSGDLFVHLFSSLHFIISSNGPDKIQATGGLRYWKDGREVPDVLLGMFDYPESPKHPAFNLSLRVNFVDGTAGSTYLRMVGSEGSMTVTWDDVTLSKNTVHAPADDPLMKTKANEGGFVYQRKKILPPAETVYKVEEGYLGAHYDHFTNFFAGVRTGKAVVEDSTFGFRAAAPALLCNNSYFDNKIIKWDPVNLQLKS